MKILLFKQVGRFEFNMRQFALNPENYSARIFLYDGETYYELSEFRNGMFPIEEKEVKHWNKEAFHVFDVKLPQAVTYDSVLKELVSQHPEWLI
jgi:hypothetical protein